MFVFWIFRMVISYFVVHLSLFISCHFWLSGGRRSCTLGPGPKLLRAGALARDSFDVTSPVEVDTKARLFRN
jgi:hypothetical protein